MKELIGVVLLSLGPGLAWAEAGHAPPEGEKAVFHVHMGRSQDGFVVGQAVRGAYRRLADSRCQAVFSDFIEPSGRRLQNLLDEQGQTGQGFLSLLMFYDGAHVPYCRIPGILAFTQPGSRVIYVCSAWFRQAFELNPAKVEAVIIHEALHSLGLGENPPRSQDITSQVMARCGL
jgi:hypothetical protein